MRCELCPNRCGVDRTVERGACLAGEEPVVNRVALHFYEEPPISGTRGSGTVFFGGCTMRCKFCQNAEISRAPKGKTYSAEALAEAFKSLEAQGAHNVNLVSPTPYIPVIKAALELYRPSIPIVYNTSGYELKEVIASLEGYVDIYLPDFKYADDALGRALSRRAEYPRYALGAIGEMLRQKRYETDENGILKTGVIVRHLVLPGEVENSRAVLDILVKEFGTALTVSLMSQFTPMPACPELPRTLKPLEYKAVLAHAEKLGIENIYAQELSSASGEFIPKWSFD